jgi:hypothetical protein
MSSHPQAAGPAHDSVTQLRNILVLRYCQPYHATHFNIVSKDRTLYTINGFCGRTEDVESSSVTTFARKKNYHSQALLYILFAW